MTRPKWLDRLLRFGGMRETHEERRDVDASPTVGGGTGVIVCPDVVAQSTPPKTYWKRQTVSTTLRRDIIDAIDIVAFQSGTTRSAVIRYYLTEGLMLHGRMPGE